jgi:DUF4097 and DUF4098 domain-containing protein YvlB
MVGVDAPSVSADTGSGDVSIGLVADAEDISIDTGSGSVALVVPPSLGAKLYVEVGSGDIDVKVPMAEIQKEEDTVRGRIGDGAGRIHIETGSGGVSIAGTAKRALHATAGRMLGAATPLRRRTGIRPVD